MSWLSYDWQECYNLFKEYVLKHKTLPTFHYKTENGLYLLGWYNRQSRLYKIKALSEDKIRLLEQLPRSIWNLQGGSWNIAYHILKEYISKHNKIPQQKYITEDGFSIGQWVRHQKFRYKRNKLSEERMKLLEQLPYWNQGHTNKSIWEQKYHILKEYISKHNTVPKQRFRTEDGFYIGKWVTEQRYCFKKNKLSEERISLLEQLPNWKWSQSS